MEFEEGRAEQWDPELQHVLAPWDPKELGQGLEDGEEEGEVPSDQEASAGLRCSSCPPTCWLSWLASSEPTLRAGCVDEM